MDNLAGRKWLNLREVIEVPVFLHTVSTEAFCPFWEARGNRDSSFTCPRNQVGKQISAMKIPGHFGEPAIV